MEETNKSLNDQIAANKQAIKEIEAIYLEAFDSINAAQSDPEASDKFKKEVLKLQGDIADLKNEIRQKEVEFISDESFESQKKKITDLAKLDKEKFEESIKARKTELKLEFKGTELEQLNGLLDLILKKRKELIDLNAQNQIDIINEKELEDFKKSVQELREVDFETELENLENQNKKLVESQEQLYEDLADATTKKQKDAIRKQIEIRNKEIENGIKKERDLRIKEIERQRDVELRNEKLQPIERALIKKRADLEILRINNETEEKLRQGNKKTNDEAKNTLKQIEESEKAAAAAQKAQAQSRLS